jgi:hypothetical protein
MGLHREDCRSTRYGEPWLLRGENNRVQTLNSNVSDGCVTHSDHFQFKKIQQRISIMNWKPLTWKQKQRISKTGCLYSFFRRKQSLTPGTVSIQYPRKSREQSRSTNVILNFAFRSTWSCSIIVRSDRADSNITSPNELQPVQFLSSSLVDRGITIDSNDVSSNANVLIWVSFDPDSNVNDESDVHLRNERSPTNSTDAGMQIDSNNSQ